MPPAAPIRSCSRWGLPCRPCCQGRGALLPHHFTLARGSADEPGERGRFVFCGTFPGVAPAGGWPAPYSRGARTFLCPPGEPGLQRPSGRLAGRDMRAGEDVRQAPALAVTGLGDRWPWQTPALAITGLCNPGRACYRPGNPRGRAGGRIAQLVEQLTLNQRAVGSSPTAPTSNIGKTPGEAAFRACPDAVGSDLGYV